MNEHLRNRIQRRLESLTDDRGYQILDYIEFLESKYGDKSASASSSSTTGSNPFTKFTEAVEDRLRAGRVSATAIAETVNLMNKATSVLNSALNATKTMASELAAVPEQMRQAASQQPGTKPASAGSTEASSPAHDTKAPGSGEEKL
jgi:hypothetical protein